MKFRIWIKGEQFEPIVQIQIVLLDILFNYDDIIDYFKSETKLINYKKMSKKCIRSIDQSISYSFISICNLMNLRLNLRLDGSNSNRYG